MPLEETNTSSAEVKQESPKQDTPLSAPEAKSTPKEVGTLDWNKILDKIDERTARIVLLTKLESLAGGNLKRSHILLIACFVSLVTVLYVWGFHFLALCIGFFYPLYASNMALRSGGKNDDTEWLIYWIIYGIFILTESFVCAVMHPSAWSPVFYIMKGAFLTWCFLPQTRGAYIIWTKIVRPLLDKYEGKIDKNLASMRECVSSVGIEASKLAMKKVTTLVLEGHLSAAPAAATEQKNDTTEQKNDVPTSGQSVEVADQSKL
eukprot:TRINITY_DN148_c0_g1_i2.p1 TRINITY_DN148_c0_g1~~TRINITY_DN148_c0_g1_i2.p1  ORF type:complete len:263 (-),score=58.98 TRINITY_DN148_c0_g1_i2:433-1221(-)